MNGTYLRVALIVVDGMRVWNGRDGWNSMDESSVLGSNGDDEDDDDDDDDDDGETTESIREEESETKHAGPASVAVM